MLWSIRLIHEHCVSSVASGQLTLPSHICSGKIVILGDPGHGCVGTSDVEMSTPVSSSSVPVTKLVESDVDFAVEFTESVVEFTGEEIVAFPVQFPDNNLERGTGVLGTAVWLVSDCVDAL